MSVLYLVRHGQASFGTDDYDRLSDLGKEQSRAVGEQFDRLGVSPSRLIHGDMLRQRQTAEGIAIGLGSEIESSIDSGWNEFNASNLLAALPDHDPRATKDSRIFQRVLEEAVARWAAGDNDGDYEEAFSTFTTRVDRALDDAVNSLGSGEHKIVVSSSGAIAWTAARLLGGGFQQWLALNRVTVNSGITKIVKGSSGVSLISFNEHSHLPTGSIAYR
ncbi:histidine phosphatase family protein [Brevibacterium aurantiacum]|uniref:Broad specificity phosphatase PhoE n=1 Tax=Brevibacterium aurantiacum TaxID=273384 RepID=A0A2H1KSE1_BREAU|nr:histidine phosphatase family protein [Brevibacterium aurantiacum]SMY02162.1 Broad specificity phosphatase PhoE [Brevibacterium aurantiacum]